MAAFSTIEVPENSLMVPRDYALDQQISWLVDQAMNAANRRQQYYELGECAEISPYRQTLNEIDSAIGKLKRLRKEMQEIAGHAHAWDDNDYCKVCGADGRA